MIPVRAYFSLLANYLRPLRPRVVLLSFVLFSTIVLQLVNPQLIKRFIDGAIDGRDASGLIPIAVTFMLIAVGQQALAIWATYLAEDIGWSATNHLRGDLTDHVIHLDMGFHKGHSAGELIERIDGDVTSLSNFFSAMMIKVVGNGGLVIGIIVMLWLESWIVGLSVSIFTVLAIVAMAGFHRAAVPWWKAVRATAAEAYGFVGEVVEGTEDITSNGAGPYMETLQRDPATLAATNGTRLDGVGDDVELDHCPLRPLDLDRLHPGIVAVWHRDAVHRRGLPGVPLRGNDPAPDGTDPRPDGGSPKSWSRHRAS